MTKSNELCALAQVAKLRSESGDDDMVTSTKAEQQHWRWQYIDIMLEINRMITAEIMKHLNMPIYKGVGK